ncbi:MAG TPA: hypothetical protein VFA26_07680, partial [Gemmataceae bacterium]|nr:hypothetical protein [Gemmataceae bacterium]
QPPPPPEEPPLPPGVKVPTPEDRPGAPPKAATFGLAGNYVPIPRKYYQAETSGLRYTVKKGTASYDVELR